jgi:DNA-directed RNA polymerase specialized sigma24 family protein
MNSSNPLAPMISVGAQPMAFTGSITDCINKLKAGDPVAAQLIWERYFQRLVRLARKHLQRRRPRAADEEDVALSAFDSFCRGAEAGRFPQLNDRDNLWRLLVVITARKASHLLRAERRQKRGGKLVPLPEPTVSGDFEAGLEQFLSREPAPEFAALVAEEYQRMLTELGDLTLQTLVSWKMEGYTNEEIARKLQCAPRSVYRKLRIIRGLWEKELIT